MTSLSRGIAVTLSAQLIKAGNQIFYMVLMSRLLSPAEFGLYAMVAPLVAMLLLIQDFGISQTVASERSLDARLLGELNGIAALLSGGMMLLMIVGSPLVAWFYNSSSLSGITTVLALSLMPAAIAAIGQAHLARLGQFQSMAILDVTATLIGYGVSAAVAALGAGPVSLAMFNLAVPVSSLLMLAFFTSFNALPRFPSRKCYSLLKTSIALLAYNLSVFAARNGDNIVIGKALGAEPVGYYDRAYKFLMLPLQQAAYPISRVVMPTLSKQIDDPVQYRLSFVVSMCLLIGLTAPVTVGLGFWADEWIPFAFGNEWAPSAAIFKWLALAGCAQVITSAMGWLFISQRRTREYFVWGVVNASTSLIAFVIGVRLGGEGVAMLYAISEVGLRLPFVLILIARSGPVGIKLLLGLLTLDVVMCCLAFAMQAIASLLNTEIMVVRLGIAALVMALGVLICIAPMLLLIRRSGGIEGVALRVGTGFFERMIIHLAKI